MKVVGIVHPGGLSDRIYWFKTPYTLEEGMDVMVETDNGDAWGKVKVGTTEFTDEQIKFLEQMEELGVVTGIFTPFCKCEKGETR